MAEVEVQLPVGLRDSRPHPVDDAAGTRMAL